jgi:LysR substrate binding domain
MNSSGDITRCVVPSRYDADVALRSRDTEDQELLARKVGDSHWAVYASQTYIDRFGQPARIEDLAQHALVGFDATLARHRAAQWLDTVAPGAATACSAWSTR